MSKETGDQAFPVVYIDNGQTDPGMTLRDYFAGQALASGMCPENGYHFTDMAAWAYAVAEAMIARRKL